METSLILSWAVWFRAYGSEKTTLSYVVLHCFVGRREIEFPNVFCVFPLETAKFALKPGPKRTDRTT